MNRRILDIVALVFLLGTLAYLATLRQSTPRHIGYNSAKKKLESLIFEGRKNESFVYISGCKIVLERELSESHLCGSYIARVRSLEGVRLSRFEILQPRDGAETANAWTTIALRSRENKSVNSESKSSMNREEAKEWSVGRAMLFLDEKPDFRLLERCGASSFFTEKQHMVFFRVNSTDSRKVLEAFRAVQQGCEKGDSAKIP